MSILAVVGEELPLTLVINDGNSSLFPQAEIYDEAGSATPVAVLNLTHITNGYYRSTTNFSVNTYEKFTVIYIVYDDAGHTVESSQYLRSENLIISDVIPVESELEGFPF